MIYFISKGLPELIITIEEFTVLRKLIAFKISAKIKLQITAEISKLYHGIVVDRNAILFSIISFCLVKKIKGTATNYAILFSVFFSSYLFLAVCIDPVLTVCLRALPKCLKVF